VITGNPTWDALGTLMIGVLLIVVAVFVAIEVKAMLIGQSADPEVQKAMKEFLAARPEIARVFSLITLQLGDDLMVAVKVQLQHSNTGTAPEQSINDVEAALKLSFPQVKWSFFEPIWSIRNRGEVLIQSPSAAYIHAASRVQQSADHEAEVTYGIFEPTRRRTARQWHVPGHDGTHGPACLSHSQG
jgi:hypothetical protein